MGNASSMEDELWTASSYRKPASNTSSAAGTGAPPTPTEHPLQRNASDEFEIARARSASPNLMINHNRRSSSIHKGTQNANSNSNNKDTDSVSSGMHKSASMIASSSLDSQPGQRVGGGRFSFTSRDSSLLRISRTLKNLSRSSSASSGFNPLESGIPVKVTKNVFLGNMDLALIPEHLNKKYGITHILNLCSNFKQPAANSGIVSYKHMEMSDNGDTELVEFMKSASEFIIDGCKKGKVFVHCRLGQNRSSTVIIAWLMIVKRMSLVNALRYLNERNPSMNIHPNYIKQLGDLEEKELGTRSQPADSTTDSSTIASSSPPELSFTPSQTEIVKMIGAVSEQSSQLQSNNCSPSSKCDLAFEADIDDMANENFQSIEALKFISNQSPKPLFDFISVEENTPAPATAATS